MKNSKKYSKEATHNVLHRIAEVKQEYGADNAESYKKASNRIKNKRG